MNCHHRPSLQSSPLTTSPTWGSIAVKQRMCLPLQNVFQNSRVGVGEGASQGSNEPGSLRLSHIGSQTSTPGCIRHWHTGLQISAPWVRPCERTLTQSHTPGGGKLGPLAHAPLNPTLQYRSQREIMSSAGIRAQRKELWVEREYSLGSGRERHRGLQPCRPASEDTHLQSGDEQGPQAGSRQTQVQSQGSRYPSSVTPAESP